MRYMAVIRYHGGLGMDKEHFWDALRTPVDRDCKNCLHFMPGGRAAVTGRCFKSDPNGATSHFACVVALEDWEWNGIK